MHSAVAKLKKKKSRIRKQKRGRETEIPVSVIEQLICLRYDRNMKYACYHKNNGPYLQDEAGYV